MPFTVGLYTFEQVYGLPDDEIWIYSSSATGDIILPATASNNGQTFKVTSIYPNSNIFQNNGITSVTYPTSFIKTGETAFAGCTNLTLVTFNSPSQIKIIDNNCFSGCFNQPSLTEPVQSRLSSITIPSSVTHIGSSAFSSNHLTEVIFESNSNLITIDNNAFTASGAYNLTIPPSVKTIGNYAFERVIFTSGLLTIPSSVTSIGNYAFYNNYSLSTITFTTSSNVTTIGDFAFNIVETTGTFQSLSSITIPSSVTSVGTDIFYPTGLRDCITFYAYYENQKYQYNSTDYTNINDDVQNLINNGTITGWNTVSESGTISDNGISYLPIGNGNVSLLSRTSDTSKIVVIPATFINNNNITYTITSIGPNAFSTNTNLTAITLPSTVTSIGSGAFTGLNTIITLTIPQSITSINQLFDNNSGIKSISLSTGPTTIVNNLFANASYLTSIILPATVTSIGTGAFKGLTGLNSFVVPSNIKSILADTFNGDVSLNNITVPSSVTSIGLNAFNRVPGTVTLTIPSSVTDISQMISTSSGITSLIIANGSTNMPYGFLSNAKYLTAITIPASVTYIGNVFATDSSLMSDSSLNKITFNTPSQLKTIDELAFCGTTYLSTLTIPNSVTTIGQLAFYNTYNLSLVNFELTSTIKILNNLTFGLANPSSNNFTITIPKSVTSTTNICTGRSVTSIINVYKNNALYTGLLGNDPLYIDSFINSPTILPGWTALTLDVGTILTINSISYKINGSGKLSLIKVYDYTSSSLSFNNLQYTTNGSTYNFILTNINTDIFNNDTFNYNYYPNLTAITIPSTVTSIGLNVFNGLPIDFTITLPSSVTSINNTIFNTDSGIKSITLSNETTSVNNNVFNNYTYLKSISIPSSVTRIGQNAFKGTSGLTNILLSEGVNNIADYAFQGASGPPNLTLPSSITYIGSYAFQNMTNIKNINILSSINSIHNNSFQGITSLTSLTIPISVTSIGASAFQGLTNVTSIIIPANVKYIGPSAFQGLTGLTSLTIPTSVTAIGASAFQGLTGLTSLVFNSPSTIKTIGVSAFQGLTGLTSLTIPTSVTSIGASAFQGLTGLTSLVFNSPSQITTIGVNAFLGINIPITIPNNLTSLTSLFNNTGMTSIIIPSSVTTIPNSFCLNASYITNIILPPSVTSIGNSAFQGTRLNYITIPPTVLTIGQNAFNNIATLRVVYFTPPDLLSTTQTPNFYRLESGVFGNLPNLEAITIPPSITYVANDCFGLTPPTKVDKSVYIHFTTDLSGTYMQKFPLTTYTDNSGCTTYLQNYVNNKTTAFFLNTYRVSPSEIFKFQTIDTLPQGQIISNYSVIDLTQKTVYLSRISLPHIIKYVVKSIVNYNNIIFTLKIIGNYSFQYSPFLRSLTIPESVTSIGNYAFSGSKAYIYTPITLHKKLNTTINKPLGNIINIDNVESTASNFIDSIVSYNSSTNFIDINNYIIPDNLMDSSLNEINEHLFNDIKVINNHITITHRGGFVSFFESIGDALASIAESIADTIVQLAENVFSSLLAFLQSGNIKDLVESIYNTVVVSTLERKGNVIVSLANSYINGTVQLGYTIYNGVVTIGTKVFNGIYDIVTNFINIIASVGMLIFNTVVPYLKIIFNTIIDPIVSNVLKYIVDAAIGPLLQTVFKINIPNTAEYFSKISQYFNSSPTLYGSINDNFSVTLYSLIIPTFVQKINSIFTNINDANQYKTLYFNTTPIDTQFNSYNGTSFIGTSYNLPTLTSSLTGSTQNVGIKNLQLTSFFIDRNGSRYKYLNPISFIADACNNNITAAGGDVQSFLNNSIDPNVWQELYVMNNVFYKNTGSNTLSLYDGNYNGSLDISSNIMYNGQNYNVTSIGDGAFKGEGDLPIVYIDISYCLNLSSFTDGCLTHITIPDSITSIGNGAFQGVTELTTITIPASVKDISDYAFKGASGLRFIIFDQDCLLNYIGNSLFEGTTNLITTTIPESITSIGNSAFSRSGIKSLILSNNLKSIGYSAFQDASGLAFIDIPSSVNVIGSNAFQNCTSLKTINIPESVTYIGKDAFMDTALSSLYINNNGQTYKYTSDLQDFSSIFIDLKMVVNYDACVRDASMGPIIFLQQSKNGTDFSNNIQTISFYANKITEPMTIKTHNINRIIDQTFVISLYNQNTQYVNNSSFIRETGSETGSLSYVGPSTTDVTLSKLFLIDVDYWAVLFSNPIDFHGNEYTYTDAFKASFNQIFISQKWTDVIVPYLYATYPSSKTWVDIKKWNTCITKYNSIYLNDVTYTETGSNINNSYINNYFQTNPNSQFKNISIQTPIYDPNFVRLIKCKETSSKYIIQSTVTDVSRNLTNCPLTVIDSGAFAGMTNLTSITFAPSSHVTTINDFAFAGTNISSITIPSSVMSIGNGAFQQSSELTILKIGNKNTVDISYNAFFQVPDLKYITIYDISNTIINYTFTINTTINKSVIINCINSFNTNILGQIKKPVTNLALPNVTNVTNVTNAIKTKFGSASTTQTNPQITVINQKAIVQTIIASYATANIKTSIPITVEKSVFPLTPTEAVAFQSVTTLFIFNAGSALATTSGAAVATTFNLSNLNSSTGVFVNLDTIGDKIVFNYDLIYTLTITLINNGTSTAIGDPIGTWGSNHYSYVQNTSIDGNQLTENRFDGESYKYAYTYNFIAGDTKATIIPPNPPSIYSQRSLYTDNARVYYKPHSLASGGVGGVRNNRHKSKKT